MNPIRRLLDALKNLGRKRKHLVQYGDSEPAETDEEAFQNFAKDTWEIPRPPPPQPHRRHVRTTLVPKAGRKAIHQDISRFMKHRGKWSPEYRKSVKAKIQPEDD